jgi:hypothetical protein
MFEGHASVHMWVSGSVQYPLAQVCPKNPNNFNVDNVRVVKIPVSLCFGVAGLLV